MNQKAMTLTAWGLFFSVTAIALISWGQTVSWSISSLTPYQWFPLFGILAWVIMWTHYVVGALRVYSPSVKKPFAYGSVTGWVVLASLLLHPGLLAFQQYRNDQGLPPESYINYVGESLQIAVMLGTISLIIFLSFEFFDRMKNNRFVKKHSFAISISQSLAMILIFVHGLRLGTTLGDGWFRATWMLMGAVLVICFYVIHKAEIGARVENNSAANLKQKQP